MDSQEIGSPVRAGLLRWPLVWVFWRIDYPWVTPGMAAVARREAVYTGPRFLRITRR